MDECAVCKRNHEHLGTPISTIWCEKAKRYICKDCCIKNGGCKCHYWNVCWFSKA